MCSASKMQKLTEKALDGRARRAAARAGYVARKSRWRRGSVDNRGGYMLVDPTSNGVVMGSRYDLTAEVVLRFFGNGKAD
jgi:hypothetical protein